MMSQDNRSSGLTSRLHDHLQLNLREYTAFRALHGFHGSQRPRSVVREHPEVPRNRNHRRRVTVKRKGPTLHFSQVFIL